ncbi:MAG: DUF262 domain-containing protein [Treponema sp.]
MNALNLLKDFPVDNITILNGKSRKEINLEERCDFLNFYKEVKRKLDKNGFHIGTVDGMPQEHGSFIFIADKNYIIGGGDGFCHYELIKGNYERVQKNEITVDGIKCNKTNHRKGYAFLELHFEFENNDSDLYTIYQKKFLPVISKLCSASYELFRWTDFHERPVICIRVKKYYKLDKDVSADEIISDLHKFDKEIGSSVREILLKYRKNLYCENYMSTINVKPKIVQVRELMHDKMTIPPYQRPYKWTVESAGILFNDIYSSFKNKNAEYRIGTVVLHYDASENIYNIVDGQQRLTSLSILSYCFYLKTKNEDYISSLMREDNTFTDLSSKAIVKNFKLLNKKFLAIPEFEKEDFMSYVLDKCTFVKIVTEREQEAFQFFDSQNSRGKALDPHDLLKSYHLREMSKETKNEKKRIVSDWENVNQKELAAFFESCLYPLVRYYKGEDGLYYSSKKIGTFKGIKGINSYNFSVYHMAANLYIEHFNSEGMYEPSSREKINQFQLTQPIIAGKRFFQYTLYYFDLAQKIDSIIQNYAKRLEIPDSGSGNLYILNLFRNILIFFVDKFNFCSLTPERIKFFYSWAYSLRVVMHSVYLETVNKYALGQSERVNCGLNLFKTISNIHSPEQLDFIILDTVEKSSLKAYKSEGYKDIWNCIFGGEE